MLRVPPGRRVPMAAIPQESPPPPPPPARPRPSPAPVKGRSPPSSLSWVVDAEGERSRLDPFNSSARLSLVRSSPPLADGGRRATPPPRISVRYDSAKYDAAPAGAAGRSPQHAPAVAVEARAPFLHPRLEVRTRGTWAVAGGGDHNGNRRGSASGAERRLERIREGYREGVPRSCSNPPPAGGAAAPPVAAGSPGSWKTTGRRPDG